QGQTSRRLEEAVHQLEVAERLKAEALTQAETARRKLAAVEHHAVRLAGDASDEQLPEDYNVTALMGKVDQDIAAEILRHVDDVLQEEATNLDDLQGVVAEQPGEVRVLSGGQSRDILTSSADNESRYRSLVRAGAQLVWVTTATGEIAEDFPEWRSITGQSLDEYLRNGWLGAVHPEDRERVARAWRSCLSTGKEFDQRYRVWTKTGSVRHYEGRAVPIERDGKIIEWVGASTDVTAQREAEMMRGLLTEQLSAAALRIARLQQATSMLAEALTVLQVAEIITEGGTGTDGGG